MGFQFKITDSPSGASPTVLSFPSEAWFYDVFLPAMANAASTELPAEVWMIGGGKLAGDDLAILGKVCAEAVASGKLDASMAYRCQNLGEAARLCYAHLLSLECS